jgi:hypothetical protein
MNNTAIHPIELALAVLLATCESALWVINELMGLHTDPAATTTPTIQLGSDEPQPQPQVHTEWIQPSQLASLSQLTVKQLQQMVGTKSSRYRKADLIEMAIQL